MSELSEALEAVFNFKKEISRLKAQNAELKSNSPIIAHDETSRLRIATLEKENTELKRDKERLDYIDSIIEYKPPFYDGCEYGRFDLVFASNINDLRQAIDAAITATKPIDK